MPKRYCCELSGPSTRVLYEAEVFELNLKSAQYPSVLEKDELMTLVMVVWLKEKHQSAKYQLIISKAQRFLKSRSVDLGVHHEPIKALLEQ